MERYIILILELFMIIYAYDAQKALVLNFNYFSSLNTVVNQICCKQARDMVKEEIENYIED